MEFADHVRKVLSKPQDLPHEFLEFLVQYVAANPVPLEALRAPMVISTGTTGATKATRWVGSTTSGAPVTGYGVVGDFVTTQDGNIYICTVAGSPGTWVRVGNAAPSNPGLMAARVNNVGPINVPEGDPGTIISWGESVVDTGTPSPFWSAAHPTRLTAPVNGIYMDLVNLEWSQLADGNRPGYVSVYLYKNGTPSPGYSYDVNSAEPASDGGNPYNMTGVTHGIFPMNAGDYWEIIAYNNNHGIATRQLLDLRPSENHYSSFSMILVGVT